MVKCENACYRNTILTPCFDGGADVPLSLCLQVKETLYCRWHAGPSTEMEKKQRGKYKVTGYPDSHSELQVGATDCAEELAMFGRRVTSDIFGFNY